MKEIVLAGGCFWGVEAYFNTIEGVIKTKVGYANGHTESPTYEQVCSHTTGFAEVCYLEYDETEVSLTKILEAYWKVVDPTILNRQGHDIGDQYRTGIYYIDESDKTEIDASVAEEQKKYSEPIVTEVLPLKKFYSAEEYHQKYLDKNPNGYCHIPRELLKKK